MSLSTFVRQNGVGILLGAALSIIVYFTANYISMPPAPINIPATKADDYAKTFKTWANANDIARGYNLDANMIAMINRQFEVDVPNMAGIRLTFGYTQPLPSQIPDTLNPNHVIIMAVPVDANAQDLIPPGGQVLTLKPNANFDLPCPRYCDSSGNL